MYKKKTQILTVDDSKLNRKLTRNILERKGYEVYEAENGQVALEILEEIDPIIILIDIVMPIMDGYTCCKQIRKNPKTKHIPVLMVTSYSDPRISERMEDCGANDILFRPLEPQELILRVDCLLRAHRSKQEVVRKNVLLENDIEIGKKVQLAILPSIHEVNVKGLQFYFQYIPCSTLGGDYFDILYMDDERVGILVVDVMGHGVSASLVTMILKTFFDSHARRFSFPGALLSMINQHLCQVLGNTLIYATAVYSIVDLNSRTLLYANAGHPPSFLFHPKKQKVMNLQAKGTILGIFEKSDYETVEIPLESDSHIFFYTDGLTDVQNEKEEYFGEERLVKLISRYRSFAPKELIGMIMRSVHVFSSTDSESDSLFEDDVQLISLKID